VTLFGGVPLGSGCTVGNIFWGEDKILFTLFLVESDSTHRDLFKNEFFEILSIYFGLRQNFWHFSEKSSLLGNRLVPIDR
jgi:hypothetical protein